MRHSAAFFLGDFVSEDVKTLMNLDLVGVYDLGGESGGEVD